MKEGIGDGRDSAPRRRAKHAVRVPISLAKPQRTQRKVVEHFLRAGSNPTYTAPCKRKHVFVYIHCGAIGSPPPSGRGWGWVFRLGVGPLVVGGHNKNFQKNTPICCRFKRYFITLPTRCHTIHLGWQIRHRWIGSSRLQDMCILRSLAQKGRLRTLSSSLESRKFNSQKIRQRNVCVGCIVSAPL